MQFIKLQMIFSSLGSILVNISDIHFSISASPFTGIPAIPRPLSVWKWLAPEVLHPLSSRDVIIETKYRNDRFESKGKHEAHIFTLHGGFACHPSFKTSSLKFSLTAIID